METVTIVRLKLRSAEAPQVRPFNDDSSQTTSFEIWGHVSLCTGVPETTHF